MKKQHYGDNSSTTAQLPENIKADIEDWLMKNTGKYTVIEYKYKEDSQEQISYAVRMPKPDNNKIGFDSNTGKYVYYVRDDNGNVVNQVTFSVDVFMDKSVAEGLSEEITRENYEEYIAPGQTTILEEKDGDLIRIIDLDERKERQMAFGIKFDDGSILVSPEKTFEFKEKTIGESLWNLITNALSWVWDTAINAIGGIFNSLLLWIADGVQSLINSIFGSNENLTIYKIIFGKIDKLSINYWETSTTSSNEENTLDSEESGNPEGIVDNAPAPTLKNIVSYWYNIFKGIAIAIYLVMLLYIGVRILLSSTGSSAQKYKDSLTSWLVGIIILIFYPYVMRYTVIINDTFVQMIDQGDMEEKADNEDAMLEIRKMAEKDGNIALTIVYIIMLGQLIVLLGVYYKRVFMMAFLITIFPIVAVLFVWEKSKGGSKALSTWTIEYVILVMTQTFHAVIYVVLVEGALSAFKMSNNWFVFILSVTFLFEAEKIIRAIFGMKSSAGTIGDLAAAGAAAWAATTGIKKVFKSNGKNNNGEDAKNAKDADNSIEEAKKNTAVNRALAQTTSSNTVSSSTSTASNVTSGGTSSAVQGNGNIPQENPLDNLQAAQAFASRDAFNKRTKKNIVASALSALPRAYTRAAGVTLGMASGLAGGSVKEGFANAAIGNEIASMGTKAIRGISGWTVNRFAGKVMKAKILSGQMDEQLREIGFDLSGSFDNDPTVSNAKAQIIREALAAQADATRKGGKVAGELAFVKAVEKGRKREHL